MGDVLAWLEAAQAEAARAQRNLPASATSPTAGGESVALAASGVAGATTPEYSRKEGSNRAFIRLVVGHAEVAPQ